MTTVETARGPVDSADLGRTYLHEHVFVLDPEIQQNHPEEWGSEDDRVADAVSRLQALADQGVRTIVDLTVLGLGRYVPRIVRIAEQVPDLNIVVATGCYTYVVVEMCRRGFASQLVLSQDASCYIDWLDPGVMALLPDWHYLHIEEKVLPYLRGHGVTEEQITTMLVDVPRRVLEAP